MALLWGALLVSAKFSESNIIYSLYWLLIIAFAFRIAAHIAFPKSYHSPVAPLLAGLVLTAGLTLVEDSAIRSAARAAMLQMQSERAAKLIQMHVKATNASRLAGAFSDPKCLETERASSKSYNFDLCNKLSIERYLNDHSTDKYLQP